MPDKLLQLQIKVPAVSVGYDKKETMKAMRQAGNLVKGYAKALASSTGSGKSYGAHKASTPGAPPAMISGLLARSISVSVRSGHLAIVARVTDKAQRDGAPYARFLEVGAVGHSGASRTARRHKGRSLAERKTARRGERVLEPRPFMGPALDQAHAAILNSIASAVQRDISFLVR